MTRKFNLNEDEIVILNQDNIPNQNEFIIAAESWKQIITEEVTHKPHFGFTKTYGSIKQGCTDAEYIMMLKKFCANCVRCKTNKSRESLKVLKQRLNIKTTGHALSKI